MRILFWSETFWPRVGGVEKLATTLLLALCRRGYDFAVVSCMAPDLPKDDVYAGIPVYRVPFFPRLTRSHYDPLLEAFLQVIKLKRAFVPDLIHINSFGRSVAFHLNTTHIHPGPLLLTLHQTLPSEPMQPAPWLARIVQAADWVACCSAIVLDQTRQLVPEIFSRSSLVHNALQAPALQPEPLPVDTPRLLCLGRLVADKGFDLALCAFAALIHRFPQARLVIAGEGPERERLEHRAAELSIAHAVDFLGPIPPENVPDLLNKTTLVVLPSRIEGFSLVALEAALMARPVVATCVGGLPEVVVHKQTGLLVEKDNRHALAEAVTILLNHPEAARQMGQAARCRALESFSWDRYVDAYDALYRKLLHDVGHNAPKP